MSKNNADCGIVPLTTFVDFAVSVGTAKVTIVRNWKKREEYDPKKDFYKPIRDRIIEMHSENFKFSHLESMQITDKKKKIIYPQLISGYKSFLGKKKIEFFLPKPTTWKHKEFEVRVNPELGLSINGASHLIKLYFKSPKVSKRAIDVITHLMYISNQGKEQSDCSMTLLDVRNSKLYKPALPVQNLTTELKGLAANWLEIWEDV